MVIIGLLLMLFNPDGSTLFYVGLSLLVVGLCD